MCPIQYLDVPKKGADLKELMLYIIVTPALLDYTFIILFVFVVLRPMSTAMVIAGRSVHLTTLFPGQA